MVMLLPCIRHEFDFRGVNFAFSPSFAESSVIYNYL
jgi:hypothetical protein